MTQEKTRKLFHDVQSLLSECLAVRAELDSARANLEAKDERMRKVENSLTEIRDMIERRGEHRP